MPSAGYEWLQEVAGGEVRRRATTPGLDIEDAWYADQGLYRCVASNTIGSARREAQSKPIRLDVTGPPQITTTSRKGARFCRNQEN